MIETIIVAIVSAFAAARIAVVIAHDVIVEKPREWFFRRFPPQDNMMIGYDYQSKDVDGKPLPASLKRKWYMVSELMTCTRCLTVWLTPIVYIVATRGETARDTIIVIAAMSVASWVAKKL